MAQIALYGIHEVSHADPWRNLQVSRQAAEEMIVEIEKGYDNDDRYFVNEDFALELPKNQWDLVKFIYELLKSAGWNHNYEQLRSMLAELCIEEMKNGNN